MGDITTLLISCFTWLTLYFTLCLVNPRRSYEWHIRTVTTIHAITVILLGLYSVFVLGPWPFDLMGGKSSDFQTFVITVSLGYFLLDLSWCLYFRTEGPVMMLHHTLSIVGLSICFGIEMYGIEMVTTITGAEITNPLLQLRWFLKETKQYDTKLGDIVDVAFMVIFGVFRIVLGTMLLISCYMQDNTDWLTRFGGTCIYSIGWLFWISIVQYGFKRYRRRYGSKSSKSTTNGHLKSNSEANGVTGSEKDPGSEKIFCSEQGNGSLNGEINGNLTKRHVANGVKESASSTDLL
ncbi:TLCD5-like protein [Mya arenaria]|uniref:TLCD5-like protein n=1 Tax=Mya arenaria TaxID=6604 RepID=A0ABY7EBM8_MYAAR|nr:TLC domain-containing protein 5-like [Mya arenaria]WAR06584.1 TLCD5-like protein [Mya arenaria]